MPLFIIVTNIGNNNKHHIQYQKKPGDYTDEHSKWFASN
jgi:hypothetical protein